MNQENGLPPEVQKFLDTHLHTAAARAEFLKTYATLENEIDRAAFRALAAAVPDEGEVDAARAFHARLAKNQSN